ncbi:bifunctional DNA primase/polymerase [Nonomuraea gerenzanensis]|uniref:DNA primase/polymerase bifunctional N-terminal domain-containing protein n=1 Tax=Nonomuraea gerenzanensis TaxID=93944 RepID=A0A1M4EMR8_9ACTN|nr:bifunctional DNA primase/polymerase [Nonomuraea gerenzanensis]UBU11621.1 bifunctional DNA primase/polymerase [Nonomuraea gerenzanensis]SBP00115.1 hypothetical protein BN4615_P9631 [Nonomuraea gerenzanensis]
MTPVSGATSGAMPIPDYFPDPLAVVERGLAVAPIPPGGRVPALKDWPNRCSNDRAVILQHWPNGSNICVGCKASGMVGIDLDRNHSEADGVESFTELCEQHGQTWPKTFTVQTPRGGLHLYYWAPAGRTFGNTTSRIGLGIDTRGPGRGNGGGYLIGPGSIVGGKPYVVVRDMPVQILPSWLADLLDPPQENTTKPLGPMPAVDNKYVAAAVQGEVQRILDTPKGGPGVPGRNDQLNRSAYALGRLVGAYVLNQATAEAALRAAADAVGLIAEDGPRAVEATIASGLGAGLRKPRYIRGVR